MSSTESASQRFAGIEDWDSTDLVDGMVEGQFAAISAVRSACPALAQAIDLATERLARGGRLIYMGAGTSGRIAAQDAAELPPTFNWPYERALVLMAGGNDAFFLAAEGAEDSEALATEALDKANVGPNDVVIALAASGRTPYAIAGLVHARTVGALTIGIYNNSGGKLGEACDIPVLLDTGAEFLAGSTRMKAGTAQKAALNSLSTGVMIKLGYVYRGLMVEMLPTNIKLVDRAAKMIAEPDRLPYDRARETLEIAGGSIKLATVMLNKSMSKAEAESQLAAVGGSLRQGSGLGMSVRLETVANPDPAALAAIGTGLGQFNDTEVGPAGRQALAVLVRGQGDAVVGGLNGYTAWGWLYVQWLWLDEAHRGHGLAGRLLEMAEAEALLRGSHGAHIDTFNPQALRVYLRAGYAIFGQAQ
ncbi:N-acetylmuramic acid 6-phosphate etherase [Devosia algicola]|uniref:N-acetylmuramic acid 6-phosphate etherase n=1 Tax=Devosia algicola TaxID=3026418 RepID=A0ABY7YNL0_9HYPH|nr:N-acetylmuramic acid 6-phosphate etherase [Devosia algicola]WDR02909.1 N-acetylmuramic acid 6-phosphate etherase [Devosia algicola]